MPKNLGFDTKTMSLERFRIFKFRPKKSIWAIFRRVTSLRHQVYGRLGWFLLIFGIIWSPGNLRLALVRPLKKNFFCRKNCKNQQYCLLSILRRQYAWNIARNTWFLPSDKRGLPTSGNGSLGFIWYQRSIKTSPAFRRPGEPSWGSAGKWLKSIFLGNIKKF